MHVTIKCQIHHLTKRAKRKIKNRQNIVSVFKNKNKEISLAGVHIVPNRLCSERINPSTTCLR